MTTYEYYKGKLKGYSYPHACLDTDLLHKNIDANIARAGNKLIRIASKSLRCPQVMRSILDTHPQVQGIMTYHGLEVLYLAQNGFDNLLMGYPIVDKELLKSIGAEIKKGIYICLMVDSPEQLDILEEVGQAINVVFPVCLDIDLSDNYPGLRFGVWRSPLMNHDSLVNIVSHLKTKKHINLEAVMGYEAQVAGLGDQNPGQAIKNSVIKLLKKRSIRKIREKRKSAVAYLTAEGFDLKIVNGGGTGSIESTSQEDVVTEVTVGSGFYNSHLFDNYSNFKLSPALFYGVQIVRKPTLDIYTCHGGGFIASGAIEAAKAPIVYLPVEGKFFETEGVGEVQTPVTFKNLKTPLNIGDPIYLRHAKAGEVCERFDHLIFVTEDGETYQAPTYRGLGLNFG